MFAKREQRRERVGRPRVQDPAELSERDPDSSVREARGAILPAASRPLLLLPHLDKRPNPEVKSATLYQVTLEFLSPSGDCTVLETSACTCLCTFHLPYEAARLRAKSAIS